MYELQQTNATQNLFGIWLERSDRSDGTLRVPSLLGGSLGHAGDRSFILQKAGGLQRIFSYIAFAPMRGVAVFIAINKFEFAAAAALAEGSFPQVFAFSLTLSLSRFILPSKKASLIKNWVKIAGE